MAPTIQAKKLKLIAKFADNMRIIPCPEVTAVDAKPTLKRKTCFVCPQNIM
jgi:hypothetical protein